MWRSNICSELNPYFISFNCNWFWASHLGHCPFKGFQKPFINQVSAIISFLAESLSYRHMQHHPSTSMLLAFPWIQGWPYNILLEVNHSIFSFTYRFGYGSSWFFHCIDGTLIKKLPSMNILPFPLSLECSVNVSSTSIHAQDLRF